MTGNGVVMTRSGPDERAVVSHGNGIATRSVTRHGVSVGSWVIWLVPKATAPSGDDS